MAKITTKVDNKRPQTQRVVLDLTIGEVDLINRLVSTVNGSRWDTDVKHAERISAALAEVVA